MNVSPCFHFYFPLSFPTNGSTVSRLHTSCADCDNVLTHIRITNQDCTKAFLLTQLAKELPQLGQIRGQHRSQGRLLFSLSITIQSNTRYFYVIHQRVDPHNELIESCARVKSENFYLDFGVRFFSYFSNATLSHRTTHHYYPRLSNSDKSTAPRSFHKFSPVNGPRK